MILSQEAIGKIEDYIDESELNEDTIDKKNYAEIEVGGILIMLTFVVFGHFVEEYNIHNEFAYNNIEDLSHFEFDGAEITEIEAYDEDGEEVEITNKSDIKYW